MRLTLFSLGALGIILMGAACSPTVAVSVADTREADSKSLTDTEEAWAKLSASMRTSADLDRFVAYYAADAVVLFPNEAPMVGRAAIVEGLKAFLGDPNFSIDFHTSKAEVAKSGDLGYTRGPYTMKMTDPATKKVVTDKGTYVTCWRKTSDGSWKATIDTTISEIPVADK
jgi:ketosteroid isomerase-like protein